MAEIRSSKSPVSPVRLPLLRSYFSVLVAAFGSSSAGYALAYPSSALSDLAELPDDRVLEKCRNSAIWGKMYSSARAFRY